jgi:hypothetical protein
VERGDRLVGVLRRATLMRALTRSTRSTREAAAETLSGVLTRSYWDALSGLVAATVTQLPPATPIDKTPDDR